MQPMACPCLSHGGRGSACLAEEVLAWFERVYPIAIRTCVDGIVVGVWLSVWIQPLTPHPAVEVVTEQ